MCVTLTITLMRKCACHIHTVRNFSRICPSPCASPHVHLGNNQMPGRPRSPRLLAPSSQTSTLAVHIVAEIATRGNRFVYEAKFAGMVETHNALYFWTDGSLRSVHTPRFCLSTYLRWLAKHYFSLPDGRGRTNSMMAQSPKPTSRATGRP